MAGLGSTEIRVGTPDPSRYHDATAVRTEGTDRTLLSLLPGGLRGVVIPRATEAGASRGYDHNAPQKVVVHTEGGAVLVDMARLRANKVQLNRAMQQNMQRYGNRKEAAVATFAQFAEGAYREEEQDVHAQQAAIGEVRAAPLQMPGTYVVPAASAGGGQILQKQSVAEPVTMPVQQPRMSNNTPLRAAFDLPQANSPVVRRVMFEIPRAGQITTYYHSVIRSDGALILVYDHSQATYPHYVPPVLEDDTGEPEPLAVLVHSDGQEQARLYLAYYSGLHFMFGSCEFFVLMVEREQVMADSNAR